MKILLLTILLPFCISAQDNYEAKIDSAVINAKKGIYWALENIPDRKSREDRDLIINDELIAGIKIEKQAEGISIESTGIYRSYTVKINLYRSYDSLTAEGYIKPEEESVE